MRKYLVGISLVLASCGYPDILLRAVIAFRGTGATMHGERYQPTSAIVGLLWVLELLGITDVLVALVHACVVRLRKLGRRGIGWPILLVLAGYIAAPFYIWRHMWRPLGTETAPKSVEPTNAPAGTRGSS